VKVLGVGDEGDDVAEVDNLDVRRCNVKDFPDICGDAVCD
jgi:hypothetical protein